jgi:hypothetical protein
VIHAVGFGNTITIATGPRPPARLLNFLMAFLIADLKQVSWHDSR